VAGEPETFSFQKMLRGLYTRNWDHAEHERYVGYELGPKHRATTLGTTDDSYGGFIVPPTYLESEFIPYLKNSTGMFQAGARVLPVSGEPVIIPTQASSGTCYWVAENASITATDVTFGQKHAHPHHLACMMRMSNFIMGQSSPMVEQIVRQDIAQNMGIELELQCLTGSGSQGKPLGIQNVTGLGSYSASARITPDRADAMVYTVENAKGMTGPGAFLMPYREWQYLRQAADGAGTPKFYEGIGQLVRKEAWGYPIYLSHNLTAGDVIFGCWREALLLQWGGMEFATADQASDGTNHAFPMVQTWIRAVMSVDFVCRQPASFVFCTNFT
jgi:HK97 family phage major capsid protein